MSYEYDHRQIAGEMGIYVFHESIGAGLPLWLPNGVAIRDALESFMKELERRDGYQRVASPHLAKEELYQSSGHLKFYAEDMFPPLAVEGDRNRYYLKPMNCPHHHLAFKAELRSYRQLPLRIAEYGQVYRYERSGALKGLSRVRGLCQNDAHIYVSPEKARDEIISVLRLHERCYKALGIRDHRYRLSLRDPSRPGDFDGDPALWQECEEILRQALEAEGLAYFDGVGDAAFYGPKIDVQMSLAGSADESIASVQLDFLSAERFDLSYIDAQGEAQRPRIIHRAPLGSHERFIAMLLERSEGRLPAWLAPVQVLLLPVAESDQSLSEALAQSLREQGLRSLVDASAGSLSKRIAAGHKLRPFAKIIIGAKEADSGHVRVQLHRSELKVSFADLPRRLAELAEPPKV